MLWTTWLCSLNIKFLYDEAGKVCKLLQNMSANLLSFPIRNDSIVCSRYYSLKNFEDVLIIICIYIKALFTAWAIHACLTSRILWQFSFDWPRLNQSVIPVHWWTDNSKTLSYQAGSLSLFFLTSRRPPATQANLCYIINR